MTRPSQPGDHPFFFTWTAQQDARPVELTGGEGAWFFTADGGKWLDLGALSYQANLGHGHPKMVAAIQRQAAELCLAPPTAVYPAKTELAARLLAMAPEGFSKVFFTLGGAEATENAIKIARMVTGRYKLVSRYRSYHGATMGALTLSGDWRRPPLEPGIPGVVHALDCRCHACPFGKTLSTCSRECASHIGEVMRLEGNVGAVILETIPGANGVMVPPPEYWPMVREACDREGALLIADEVLTGFGRTGRWLGIEHFGVTPDLITLAKGLTGGYAPLGAVLVHEKVARHFDDKVLLAGLTNYAHPLGCAAGLEAMRLYEDEGLIPRAAALETTLMGGLTRLAERHPERVRAVRGKGLLGAFDLSADASQWKKLRAGLHARRIHAHVYPSMGHVIVSPPLVISAADLEAGIAGLAEAVGEALA